MGKGQASKNRADKRNRMEPRGDGRGGRKPRLRGRQKSQVASGIYIPNTDFRGDIVRPQHSKRKITT